MLSELHRAREALSRKRERTNVANATFEPTWQGYCADIGLSRASVNRWLSRFDPETGEIVGSPASGDWATGRTPVPREGCHYH